MLCAGQNPRREEWVDESVRNQRPAGVLRAMRRFASVAAVTMIMSITSPMRVAPALAQQVSPETGSTAMTDTGLKTVGSHHDPKQTMDRLVAAVTSKGLTVLARIDHAGAAEKVGMALRPTEVLIFGNPKGGTPLMQAVQTIGIDLPLKALVWQDEAGKTWITYNDPDWLARRHGVTGQEKVLAAMTSMLAAVTAEAAGA
jgi:uncharacterized protein (DUF302 family)